MSSPTEGQEPEPQPAPATDAAPDLSSLVARLRIQETALDLLERKLTGKIDESADGIRTLEDDLAGMLAVWSQRIESHLGIKLSDKPDHPAPTAPPVMWVQRASDQDWLSLSSGVQRLIETVKPISMLEPPPCWPLHDGYAEELHGVYEAWVKAVADDAKGDDGDHNDALNHFFAYVYWPTLDRLRTNLELDSDHEHSDNDEPEMQRRKTLLGLRPDARPAPTDHSRSGSNGREPWR